MTLSTEAYFILETTPRVYPAAYILATTFYESSNSNIRQKEGSCNVIHSRRGELVGELERMPISLQMYFDVDMKN